MSTTEYCCEEVALYWQTHNPEIDEGPDVHNDSCQYIQRSLAESMHDW